MENERIIGIISEIDQKLSWLLRFCVQTDSEKTWMGIRTSRPSANQKAFIARIFADENTPPEVPTTWSISYSIKEEKGYQNAYLVEASTVEGSVGLVPADPAHAAIPSHGAGLGSSSTSTRDASIARAVSLKAAVDSLPSLKKMGEGDLLLVVSRLTEAYEAILNRTYSAEDEDTGESTETQQADEIFVDEPSV